MNLVQLFVKVHNEKVEFQKAECLIKAIKKCFLKKLNVWLTIIKVAVWGINYQKGQCIYKGVYFILNNNNNNKYIIDIILIMFGQFFFFSVIIICYYH